MVRQLPLKFEPRDVYSFETLVPGDNGLAVELVQQCALGTGEQQIYLWGGRGDGKSHILQAACHAAASRGHSVCYLPLDQLTAELPGQSSGQSAEIFDALEQLNLVCLDGIEALAASPPWEEALFDLINRMREAGSRLILASSAAPDALQIHLPDLHSRLLWGPVFQLQPLSDADKYQALRIRAKLRGLDLAENVADYLMRHYPRDLFDLFERLNTLDSAAMATQRRLTIPLIKDVFERSDA